MSDLLALKGDHHIIYSNFYMFVYHHRFSAYHYKPKFHFSPISMPSTNLTPSFLPRDGRATISSSKHHGVVPQHGIQVSSLSFDTTITRQRPQFISWKGMHHVGILGKQKTLAHPSPNWDHLTITWVEMSHLYGWFCALGTAVWFPRKSSGFFGRFQNGIRKRNQAFEGCLLGWLISETSKLIGQRIR